MEAMITKPKFDRANHCRQIAGLGGKSTYERYGKGFMSEIGKIGFDEFAIKHHDGNRAKAIAALRLMTNPDRNVRQPR
jgi:hypothetical protein